MNRTYILLRHGESQANVEGIIASRFADDCADPGLTEHGQAQADASISAYLEKMDLGNCTAVSSPFRRTRQTAEVLCGILRIDYTVDLRLRERDFGIFDGGPDSSYDIVWQNDAANIGSDTFDVEPLARVAERIGNLVRVLEETGSGDHVFLVSHGDVCSIALTYFAGRSLSEHRACAMANAECRPIAFAPTSPFFSKHG